MIKHVEKQLKRKRVYSDSCVRVEPITVWKFKCQGIEASGHMASAIRNSNEYIHVSALLS